MENKSIYFNFDMGRKEYLKEIAKYPDVSDSESDISHYKEKFSDYYDIKLDHFLVGKGKGKFLIPYEMSALFCLMMGVMKSNPTFDGRKNNMMYSLTDIIKHNERVIKSIDNLPGCLADYLKMTPEYYNAIYLVKYIPIILERMSALLHLILDATKVPAMNMEILDYLIDGLDDVYERCFWKKVRSEDNSEWMLKHKDFLKDQIVQDISESSSETYHLLDNKLAIFFGDLDRGNWPDDAESKIKDLLKKWEEKYKDKKDKDAKIKDEYLFWLCNQEWHVLHKTIANPVSLFPDALINERVTQYDNRYNRNAIICPHFMGNNKKNLNEDEIQRYNDEISRIEQSLRNEIDTYLVQFLMCYLHDLSVFKEVFQQPIFKLLSKQTFLFIKELLNINSTENVLNLLSSYLKNTQSMLNRFDDKYKRYELKEYVNGVIAGTKGITNCCREIYANIFVKIQSQKCEQFSKKDYRGLKDNMEDIAGKALTEIINKDKP